MCGLKKLLLFIVVSVLSIFIFGCSIVLGYHSTPDSFEEANSLVFFKSDFNGGVWLTSEPIVDINYANVIYHLKVNYSQKDNPRFIQIYANYQKVGSWCFLSSAEIRGQSEPTDFSKINRELVSLEFGGVIHEYVAVGVSLNALKEMAKNDTLIKLNGKKCNYEFSVSRFVSQAILAGIASDNKQFENRIIL